MTVIIIQVIIWQRDQQEMLLSGHETDVGNSDSCGPGGCPELLEHYVIARVHNIYNELLVI